MKKGRRVVLLALLSCVMISLNSCQTLQKRQVSPEEEHAILSAAEKTFLCLNEKRYRDVWESISRKSRDAVIRDVLDACEAFHIRCDEMKIRESFARGGPDALIYWENFLSAFDPNSVIRESRWMMGKSGAEEADIAVLHRDSDREAVFRVVKEDGVWKMGLEESFGVRKRMLW
ncbi:MAG: hypothetical protein AB2L22_10570 [Syntrophales bacterium]